MVGRTILHYQFQEKLGAGGMGEIYKAQDTRLNRFVAIKVLTSAATGDPDRRRRFIQEAQAASALNHPNIITIHDIVSEGGTDFMVMEFVSGKTLVDLIPKGGLRVSQVLKYSVQMADALQAAHNAGIVHRDLKPGNVMVTDSGLVKILDFGLAKLTDRGPLNTLSGPTDVTQTMTEGPLTVEGSIIGTVSYMSPEQAQGKKVDTRSDIFSFGVVLYEMITGTRAFEGESTLTTLSAILRDDVRPVAEFAPEAPPQLEQVIKRCLRKSPDDRWQTMKDVQMALAALKHESDSGAIHRARLTGPFPAPPPRSKSGGEKRKGVPGPVFAGALIGLVALVAIVGSAWWKHHKAPPPVEQAAVEPAPPGADAAPAPAPVGAAATAIPPSAGEAMTDDVIQMAENKVPDTQIISHIRSSKTEYTLTKDDLIRLNKAGVPEIVIDVMLDPKRAAAPAPTTASAVKPAPAAPAPAAASNTKPASAVPAPAAASSATKPVPAQQPPAVAQPAPPAAIPQPPPAQPANSKTSPAALVAVTVMNDTTVAMTLADDIPESAEAGWPVHFKVSEDVRQGDIVVIAKGAMVTGAIAEVPKTGFHLPGTGGKLTFTLAAVAAVDGHPLKLKPRNADGSYRPVQLPGVKPPKGSAASAGTAGYVAHIDGDQTVTVRR